MNSVNIFPLKTLPGVLIRNSSASNISYLSLSTGVLQTDTQTDTTGIITACFTAKSLNCTFVRLPSGSVKNDHHLHWNRN
jgi:hypothetical protein